MHVQKLENGFWTDTFTDKKLASQIEIVKSQFENSLYIKTYHYEKLATGSLFKKIARNKYQ